MSTPGKDATSSSSRSLHPARESRYHGVADARVVLIKLLDRESFPGDDTFAPVGIAYVQAALQDAGVNTDVLQWDRLMGADTLVDHVRAKRPHIVGLSATSCELGNLEETARAFRAALPKVWIVAGGYCSADAVGVLRDMPVDVVVIGEGERTAAELFPALLNDGDLDGIHGIAYGVPGAPPRETAPRAAAPVLDDLPEPGYTHWPRPTPMLQIYASRGCPHRCTYCSIHEYYGTRTVRRHGSEYIGRLVDRLIERNGAPVRSITFTDDNFLHSGRHLENMAAVARSRGLVIEFQARPSGVIRHREALAAHADILLEVAIGVESFARTQLDRWMKATRPGENRRALEILSELRIPHTPYLILSDEFTTPAEIKATCDAVRSLPPTSVPWEAPEVQIPQVACNLLLNRLMDIRGQASTRPEAAWLDDLWLFIKNTRPIYHDLCDATWRLTSAGNSDSDRQAVESLIDARFALIATLAEELAGIESPADRNGLANSQADEFVARAGGSTEG
jgi:pyruvate-formate lyase-activating enzyme